MRTTWRVDPLLEAELARADVGGAAGLYALGGPLTPGSTCVRINLPDVGLRGVHYLKRYHYPGWAKSKGLIGRGTLFGLAPEIHEFDGLTWLRANALPAVRPVAAASTQQGLRLVTHALLTEWVPEAPDLAARLADPDDPLLGTDEQADSVLAELLDLVRRMHDLRFRHRNLDARNILVRPDGRLVLLDCRRWRLGYGREGRADDLRRLLADLVPRYGRDALLAALETHYARGDAQLLRAARSALPTPG